MTTMLAAARFPLIVPIMAMAMSLSAFAGPTLPTVSTGTLILYLDSEKGVSTSGGFVDSWADQSAFGNNLSSSGTQRPSVAASGTFGLPRQSISFDGVDDLLARSSFATAGSDSTFSDLTMFMVTAIKSNAGGFRALMSGKSAPNNNLGSGTDGRDYLSGYNLDLGSATTSSFSVLNLEGAKWSGQSDLTSATTPFSQFHVLSLDANNAGTSMTLYIDGAADGSRSSAVATADMVDFRLAARYYDNDTSAAISPGQTGYLDGNFAAVLLYEGNLSDTDRQAVESFLTDRFINGINVPEPGSLVIFGLGSIGLASCAVGKKCRRT
jgi:hypothetical protein